MAPQKVSYNSHVVLLNWINFMLVIFYFSPLFLKILVPPLRIMIWEITNHNCTISLKDASQSELHLLTSI